MYDIYCVICGAPFFLQDTVAKYVKKKGKAGKYLVPGSEKKIDVKKYKWLEIAFGLGNNDKKYNLLEYNLNGKFEIIGKKKTFTAEPGFFDSNDNEIYGVACHAACYFLLKNKFNINLTFNMIPKSIGYGGLMKIKYPIIHKYQDQIFDMYDAINENEWILHAPILKSENSVKNKERILKFWKPYIPKIKKS